MLSTILFEETRCRAQRQKRVLGFLVRLEREMISWWRWDTWCETPREVLIIFRGACPSHFASIHSARIRERQEKRRICILSAMTTSARIMKQSRGIWRRIRRKETFYVYVCVYVRWLFGIIITVVEYLFFIFRSNSKRFLLIMTMLLFTHHAPQELWIQQRDNETLSCKGLTLVDRVIGGFFATRSPLT